MSTDFRPLTPIYFADLFDGRLDDPLAAAQLGDTVLAAQTFQYNADLIFREKCRCVTRRMFFTTCVAGSFSGPDFCLIFAP
jgi:hypothetical protein